MRELLGWVLALSSLASVGCSAAEDLERTQLGLGGAGGGGPIVGGQSTHWWTFRRGSTVDSLPYDGVTDVTIQPGLPNQGSVGYCLAKGGSIPRQCLVRWDLSQIPTTATVGIARFRFFVGDPSVSTFSIFKMLSPWSESQATWADRTASSPWQLPGATGATDSDTTSLVSFKPDSSTFFTVTLPPEVVQGWVASPTSNHGILIGNLSTHDGFNLSSSEEVNSTLRPTLEVFAH